MTNTNDKDLEAIRSKIDAIDDAILRKLAERFTHSEKIAKAKQNAQLFRPGREADLLRSLFAKTDLSPFVVETLWRQIIAISLANQKRLTIAIGGVGDVATATRFRFGASHRYLSHKNTEDAFSALLHGKADLAAIAHWQITDWLTQLIELRKENKPIFIASTSPLVAHPDIEPVVILAPYLPDASDSDITLTHQNGRIKEIEGYDENAPNLLGIIQKTCETST